MKLSDMDKGRWDVWCHQHKIFVISDDFKHDVSLHILGDFESVDQRMKYAQLLCDALNEASK